jgi:hypothetical protein
MKSMKAIRAIVLVILLVGHSQAWSGFDEGVAAYEVRDYATALREWRPLAEQGDAGAQYNLGYMYGEGQGVSQDYKEAIKWYRKAAEQGNVDAQNNLGFLYVKGRGITQDFIQAHKWFNIAGASGHEMGSNNRDITAIRMTPAQVAEAQKLAREWIEKHP